jgi:hypothetical protein
MRSSKHLFTWKSILSSVERVFQILIFLTSFMKQSQRYDASFLGHSASNALTHLFWVILYQTL